MYFDIIILSMLRHGPVHGYELKRRVQQLTMTFISNNSLYPALRRFELSGIATKTVESQEGRPPRKVYAITDHGRAYFDAAIRTLPTELAGNDREFLARVSFFGEIGLDDRRAILHARDAVLGERAAALRTVAGEPSRTPDRSWRDETTAWFIASVEAERRWIAELARKSELARETVLTRQAKG